MRKLIVLILIIMIGAVGSVSADSDAKTKTLSDDDILIAPNPHYSENQDVIIAVTVNDATLRICEIHFYNIAGEWIDDIAHEDMQSGQNADGESIRTAAWNTTNHKGERVASGIYFVHVVVADNEAGKQEKTKKLAIIR